MKKLLFLFSIAALLPFFFLTVSVSSCNQPCKNDTVYITEPHTTVGVQTISGNLYSLKIKKAEVDDVLATPTMKKLIFQFFIDKDSLSPTLVAFPAKNQNVILPNTTTPNSKKLIIENSVLAYPNQFYFGDQQILASKIATLIDENTAQSGPEKGKYDFLRFTPKYNRGDKHLYYEISVVPSVVAVHSTADTQPSPPANAN